MVPWHNLYSHWLWLLCCGSVVLNWPLTPLSSVLVLLVHTAHNVAIEGFGVGGEAGAGTGAPSLRLLIGLWKALIAGVYLLWFRRLRRAAWWRAYVSSRRCLAELVPLLAYFVWLEVVVGRSAWDVYMRDLPRANRDKGAVAILRKRGWLIAAPAAVALSFATARLVCSSHHALSERTSTNP